jgi:hypothetical protein
MKQTKLNHLILIISLLGLIFSGCSAQPAAKPNAVATSPSPGQMRATILATWQANKEKSWRYQGDVVLANGEKHHTEVEYAPPDRNHIISDKTNELIVIGQQVYLKESNGWQTSKTPAANIVDQDFMKRLEASLANLEYLGPNKLADKPMQVYHYNSLNKIGEDQTTITTTLWIGEGDNLPYQMVMDGKIASLDKSTGKIVGTKATSILLYEYDPTIQIDSPVK